MIKWDNSLSVSIDIFDMQHKELIDIINTFYLSIEKGVVKEKMLESIEALKDYTIVHFQTEERYMAKYEYPELEKHKTEHTYFVKKVRDFEDRYKNGKLLLSLEVTSFLKEWLTNHILHTDKKCGVFLNNLGLH